MTPAEELKINQPSDLTTVAPRSSKLNFLAEVTALEQAEAVISGIEETQLNVRPRNFPTSNLQKKISDLREAMMQMPAEPERVRQAEIRLRQELGLWRMSLAKRDDNFSAFDLRNFCEGCEQPVDNETLTALGKFYRNMPPTAPVLSKFDYVVTQYFSNKRGNSRRALRFDTDKIVAELRQLNYDWTDGASGTAIHTQAEIRESISALAKLSANAKAHKTLKNWLDNEFFNYTRAVKRRLVENFFVPEVTAAVVVCNLVVGNHFAALCEADSDKLTETASMFTTDENASQAASKQLSQAFQNLLHFSLEESSAETVAQERLTNLVTLTFAEDAETDTLPPTLKENTRTVEEDAQTESISQAAPAAAQTETVAADLKEDVVENQLVIEDSAVQVETAIFVESSDQVLDAEFIAETPQDSSESNEANVKVKTVSELEAVLGTLARHKPNVLLIKSYLQKSPSHEVRTLNLAVFLPELSDVVGRSDDKTLRCALSVIIRAQDLTQFVERGEGDLLTDLVEEINLLNAESQEITQLLRNSMRSLAGAHGEKERINFENLLYATNTLVESQLRLNSAVVRRQPVVDDKPTLKAELKFEKIKFNEPISNLKTTAEVKSPRRVNLSLVVAAAVLIMIGGGLYFFNFFGTDAVAAKSSFKVIELNQLNHGSILAGAKVNKETLFAFAGKEWDAQSAEQKKEKLRSMMNQSAQFGFKKIIVMNKEGQVIASAWDDEVSLS